MKKIYSFTLIELLVVVGIIVILAGLLLPAVMGGAEQGRITQAKSDMKSILMALNQMETTYHKMVTPDGSDYKFDGHKAAVNSGAYGFAAVGPEKTVVYGNTFAADAAAAGDAFIAELCGFTKNGASSNFTCNTNVRKIKFLDLKNGFDPSKAYNHADNKKQLWRDPWGNAYVIIVNTDGKDQIPHPAAKDTSGVYKDKILSAKALVYSYGPNGTDDQGRNVATGGGKLEDDVTSWDN